MKIALVSAAILILGLPANSNQHPRRNIDLDIYERHMADDRVGPLQLKSTP